MVRYLIGARRGHGKHRVPGVGRDVGGQNLGVGQGDWAAPQRHQNAAALGVGGKAGGGGKVGTCGSSGTGRPRGTGCPCRARRAGDASYSDGTVCAGGTCRSGGSGSSDCSGGARSPGGSGGSSGTYSPGRANCPGCSGGTNGTLRTSGTCRTGGTCGARRAGRAVRTCGARGSMNNKKTNYQLKCGYVKPLRNGC